MEEFFEGMKDAAQNLGWTVEIDENTLNFKNFTSLGYSYTFEASKDTFLQDIQFEYENYDADEFIETWVKARHNDDSGLIPSIRKIVKDADEIDEMLKELHFGIYIAAVKYEDQQKRKTLDNKLQSVTETIKENDSNKKENGIEFSER